MRHWQAGAHGHGTVILRVTASAEEGRTAAREAAEGGAGAVMAAGGDGTVRSIASGLVAADVRVPLWIAPLGRGNDIARGLGLPRGLRALRGGRRAGREFDVDVGLVATGGREEVFLSTVGVGFEGAVALRACHLRRARSWAYLAGAARELCRATRVFAFDGWLDDVAWHATGTSLSIANMPCTGGGVRLSPAARSDDGELDLALCTEVTRRGLLRALVGGRVGRPPEACFARRRLRRSTLHVSPAAPVHADGEVIGDAVRELHVAVSPGALRVRGPT